VSEWIANARMYAVTPEVESLWRELLERVAIDAGATLKYVPYPAPRPLEQLWSRSDLGAVFMCGYPIALKIAPVVPIAAPIPRARWASGRAVYRTDLIVRRDAPFRSLEETFGLRAGFTVAHSHSGFNALRHHLLAYRNAQRPAMYAEMLGNLVTARNVLENVRNGRIDVGPLDAYWHMLLARHAPALTADVRVVAATALAPMPAFVAAADAPADLVSRLRAGFVNAKSRDWFGRLAEPLLLEGFVPVSESSFALMLDWEREAEAAGYDQPA
jgi:ABC-type phosphate/phosphonate transport system substrate-binding protein